jgi:excinuclease ABC subunit C
MSQNGYPDRSHLPTSSGVYVFKDAEDRVVYVGKAKNIRSRVASYFTRSGDGRPKIAELRERVRAIDFIVTKSETEALVLESNLIKRHRPRFNASLKDDKSYPYIVVTTGDEYPKVYATRGAHDPRHRYFGPFPSAGAVSSTVDVLNKTFPFRKCRGPEPGRRSGVPCLHRCDLQGGLRQDNHRCRRVPGGAGGPPDPGTGDGDARGRRRDGLRAGGEAPG